MSLPPEDTNFVQDFRPEKFGSHGGRPSNGHLVINTPVALERSSSAVATEDLRNHKKGRVSMLEDDNSTMDEDGGVDRSVLAGEGHDGGGKLRSRLRVSQLRLELLVQVHDKGQNVTSRNMGRKVLLNEAYKQSNPDRRQKTPIGVSNGATMISLVDGNEARKGKKKSNVGSRGTINRGSLTTISKENVSKGLKVRKPVENRGAGRRVLSEWVQNLSNSVEDFGATDGSTPINLKGSNDISWIESSSDDEDRENACNVVDMREDVLGPTDSHVEF
ncbi:hypothetical protein V6N13_142256 [Hibiscus sabdariffa]